MSKKQVIDYYKKWTSNKLSNENAIAFTEMLLKKTLFATQNNRKVYAYDNLHTGKELEQMYCIAEDIFTEMPELRGKKYE